MVYQSLWKREKNRILAACILAAIMLLFCAVIWRLQNENDKLKETMGRIMDENNELKAKASEKCKEDGPDLLKRAFSTSREMKSR